MTTYVLFYENINVIVCHNTTNIDSVERREQLDLICFRSKTYYFCIFSYMYDSKSSPCILHYVIKTNEIN